MSVAELQTKLAAAKAAYKANKEDKSLKKAYKAIQVELEAAEAAAKAAAESKKRKAAESSDDSDSDSEDEPAAKKAKVVDVAALQAAAVAAKKAYKANKEDKSLKTAYKAAKEAAEAAVAAQGAAPAAEAKVETPAAAPVDDVLSGLKKKPAAAAAATEGGNPPTAKLFIGNLSWDIDDDGIKAFFSECGEPVDIHWLTDRESGKFKGCGFIEFASVELAQKGQAKNGEDLMGRPIKIDFATPRPGGAAGGAKKGGSKFAAKPIGEMPEGCTTAFAGNLSFNIDDDQMHEFAKGCGEIKSIRWLTDRNTGDFKGCGFVEFYDGDAVKEFVKKNGSDLLGRAIRLDYSAPRPPRD